jgi:glycosyltransferase involved in cell wall biosynthesis
MPAIYKLADVVISASTDPEAFGRVVAEAQAMGRPTVAVNHGGGPEIILDGETGWLFEPGNTIDLTDKIKLALDLNKRDREIMAQRAIDRTKINFNNDIMCEKTLNLYMSLVNSSNKNEE